jgi:hypothetical protein
MPAILRCYSFLYAGIYNEKLASGMDYNFYVLLKYVSF